jgi:hypothetical protein
MKDKAERVQESVAALRKLYELGIPRSFPVSESLKSLLSEYVEQGEYRSGKIHVPEVKRNLVYRLHEDKPIEIFFRVAD